MKGNHKKFKNIFKYHVKVLMLEEGGKVGALIFGTLKQVQCKQITLLFTSNFRFISDASFKFLRMKLPFERVGLSAGASLSRKNLLEM